MYVLVFQNTQPERCRQCSYHSLLALGFTTVTLDPWTPNPSLVKVDSCGWFKHLLGEPLPFSSLPPKAVCYIFLLPLHHLSSFLNVGISVFVVLLLVLTHGKLPSWEETRISFARDKTILMVLCIGQVVVHSLTHPANDNEHFQWLWPHSRCWGYNGGHADIVSPSWSWQPCDCVSLIHISAVVFRISLFFFFFKFSITSPTHLPQTWWTSLEITLSTPLIPNQ